MNGYERISKILRREKPDRIGIVEHFWGDTYKLYESQGHIKNDESFEEHFDLDIIITWPMNMVADLDFENKIIAETEDTYTELDGNGAYLKRHKHHDTTPEHVDFTVKSSKEWKEYKKFFADIDLRRLNFDLYREKKEFAKKTGKFFTWGSPHVFELMHPICGHEHMLVGMALEPEWILDMAETYNNQMLELQKILFEKEGPPDGMFYYEDMGFKQRPFMSPDMYKELIFPFHKKSIDYAHSLGLPVIMHSCGYIEPLLPDMIEAGIDCLEVIEVKAGMDLLKIYKEYGDKIALMGGIDVRILYTNDKELIDKELESKIPIVKEGYGYILHSDHSIPNTVNYETLKYFFEKGKELGTY